MATFLLDLYIRSLLLGSVFSIVLLAFRGQSAAVRHSIAIGGLAILLALPLVRLLVPTTPLDWLPAVSGDSRSIGPNAATLPPMVTLRGPQNPERGTPKEPNEGWILVLVLLGPGLYAARYLFGASTLCRWAKGGSRVEAYKGIPVVQSHKVTVPMTAWIGHHIILLPTLWTVWPENRKKSALEHELSHVRRLDCLWLAISQLACAFYWANPFAWVLAKLSRDLAEQAADDAVLATGTDRHTYAQDLLDVARESRAAFPVPAISMANESQVARRIKMVLNTNTRRGSATFTGIVLSASLLVLAAAPFAATRLTRRQATVAPPTHAQATKSGAPPAFKLSCTLLKEPILLSSLVSAKDNKPGLQATSSAVLIDPSRVQDLVKSWKQAKQILSEPKVLTLTGEAATINFSVNHSDTVTLKVLPTYQSAHFTLINLSFKRDAGHAHHLITAEFLAPTPGALLLTEDGMFHKKPIVIGLMTLESYDPTINP